MENEMIFFPSLNSCVKQNNIFSCLQVTICFYEIWQVIYYF